MNKEERKVGLKEGFNYFGALGNETYLKNHIAYFEKKLEKEIEPYKRINLSALAQCHNFAVWIRLYTELICNNLYWSLHRASGNWERISNLSFGKLTKEIHLLVHKENRIKKESKYKLQNMIKSLNYVIELRNSFQHGGMPNPMRKRRCKVDEMVLVKMLNPRHYKRTKIIFSCAYELFKLLPKPQIGVYANQYLKNGNKKA